MCILLLLYYFIPLCPWDSLKTFFLFAPWIYWFFFSVLDLLSSFSSSCGVSSLGLYASLWSSFRIGIALKGPSILIIRPHSFLMIPVLTPPVLVPKLCSVALFSYMVDSSHGITHFIFWRSEIEIITPISNSSHLIYISLSNSSVFLSSSSTVFWFLLEILPFFLFALIV